MTKGRSHGTSEILLKVNKAEEPHPEIKIRGRFSCHTLYQE